MSLQRSTSDAPPSRSLSHSQNNPQSSSSSQPQQQVQQSQQQQQQQQAQTPEESQFSPLERAGKVLEERLNRDERWVGVGDSLGGEHSFIDPTAALKALRVYKPSRSFVDELTWTRRGGGALCLVGRAVGREQTAVERWSTA